MIEINLIPDIKQELIKAQRARSIVILVSIIVGVSSAVVVLLLVIYIVSVQNIRGGIADNSITQENKTLSNVADLSKMLTIQNQLTKISALNSSKHIDSRIFNLLNNIIPPATPPDLSDIMVSNISVDSTTQTISIDGQSISGYSGLETLKKTIGGAGVKYTDTSGGHPIIALASDISTADVSYGEDSSGVKVLRFTISFTYAKELFSLDSKDATVVITINGNVTDSYQGVPRSIFTDRAKDLSGAN